MKGFKTYSTRSSVTIMLCVTYCLLAAGGSIESTNFETVLMIALSFYFGGSTALDDPSKKKGSVSNDSKTTEL